MSTANAVSIDNLSHRYGDRVAVRNLSLSIAVGEIFALLGPNGSGKTTLFRVLSTLLPAQEGEVLVFGHDLGTAPGKAQAQMGVVFQAPGIDRKLTVRENLRHHGRLYGLGGTALRTRCDEMLSRLGLAERARDYVETLSGGLRRRVELAQAMLHRPQMLLMDEPSTGLDPGARSDVWQYLQQVRQEDGVTVVLTTHLLDEAERADRIGIMHHGELVALDAPAALQGSVGGDAITIKTTAPEQLCSAISQQFDCDVSVVDGTVRLEQPQGHEWVPRLVESFGQQIDTITIGKPTLEDVFIDRTGHRFWKDDVDSN
ncbi:MAG: ABC transporter ATP-binding protein [Pirellulales bacterium]|nr:ABC transporter ATP-binding protein [Pirellulales bacterium]